MTRAGCLARDAADPLAPLRHLFALDRMDADGIIYLDGNSLGPLPRATVARVAQVVEHEWGIGLVRSWNESGWMSLSAKVAGRIAGLIGARPGEIVVADSTSINLFKVLSAAIDIVKASSPRRRRMVSERHNFPSDLYIADTLARAHGFELALADDEGLAAYLDDGLGILLLSHVSYRTGRMHRVGELTQAAHRAGGLMVWDLSHSTGAVPVDLHGGGAADAAADFAVGCGYKFLNGGPGAPAFAWAHPRHTARMDFEAWRQPLSGWFGHAAPFEFSPNYRPAAGMARFACGTPPILSLAALECGVETVLAADPYGGLPALRQKSIALSSLFIDLVDARCGGHDLALATPRDQEQRGSQVSFAHPAGGYAIVQALIARGVVGDFRAPDLLRFGFAPLYTRFVDVWDAVDRLALVLATGEWREPRFSTRPAAGVT